MSTLSELIQATLRGRCRPCLLLWLTIFVVTGCAGGGTTGTGLGQVVSADGVIRFESGAPASGFMVRASTDASDDTAVSDESGKYELMIVAEPHESVTFTFDAEALNIHWESTVAGLPPGTARFTVSWIVRPDGRVTPLETLFFDENGNGIEIVDQIN